MSRAYLPAGSWRPPSSWRNKQLRSSSRCSPTCSAPAPTSPTPSPTIDGDGDLDLFVGFDGTPNRLYRNDKGTFTDVAAAAGVADARPTRAAAWGDVDADGDPDLLLGFTPAPGGSVLQLYRNDARRVRRCRPRRRPGRRRPAPCGSRRGSTSTATAISISSSRSAIAPTRSSQRRAASSPTSPPTIGLADTRKTVGAVWFDYDEDGDLDVAVANMDGDANGLFRNDGGTFADVAEAAGVAWGGRAPQRRRATAPCASARPTSTATAGSISSPPTTGRSASSATAARACSRIASAAWGIAIDSRYDACASADVDHDGRLDLYVNGTVTGGASWQDSLFRNTGVGVRRRDAADDPQRCRPITACSGPTSTATAISTSRSPARAPTACTS